MILDELVHMRAFPAVVQAAEIRELRNAPTSTATLDFVRGYLGFDDRSRHALETITRSLATKNGQNSGGAFFLNGVFGSGKSHLLGVIALLGDGVASDVLRESHPHLSPMLDEVAPRFVVHFSLDEYSAARFSLEEIVWREIAREWTRRGFDTSELEFPQGTSRGETFAAFDEALRRHNFDAWMICIDELSLFLSGREHRALQQDAAWLQFLGQRARLNIESSTRCAFHMVAALQKTVEDIGDIDAYALSQIRDRFTTLPLSLAHLPSLVERRLVVKRDPEKVAHLCDETYAQATAALPHLDFGRDEWRRLYPFHPATIETLEKVSSRFGSRTRSAVVFCQGIEQNRDARQRVLVDEVFDFFEPELHTYPDLKPLVTMWQAWPETENDLARDANEARVLRAVMKALIVFKIAGVAPTVAQIANALLLDVRLPAEGNYEYARVLLERMRVQSGGLAIEKRDGTFADRYTLDSGARVGELARRGVSNVLHTLPQGDNRVAAYALSCCRAGELPLASLKDATSSEVLWHHTPRRLRIHLQSAAPSPENLVNTIATLATPDGDDALLFLVSPLQDSDISELHESWRSSMEKAAELWAERAHEYSNEYSNESDRTRWRAAIAWWIPRAPTTGEWDEAREATAQHLLLNDPQLGDNRRGKAVLEYLRERISERENALSRLCVRLMREGSLSNGAGSHLEAGDLALGESWNNTLEAMAAWCLPTVFPRFERHAPRLRVLAPATVDALCLETLRRPHDAPFYAPSQERNVRALAQPLGIARESTGRWKISPPRDELTQAITGALSRNDGAISFAHLEAELRKSTWGLDAGQTRLIVCALVRSGALSACDARGQVLSPREIGLPLSRSVHRLRGGQLLDEPTWQQLQRIVGLFSEETLGEVSFEEQERARQIIETWREESLAATELAQARLHQLAKRLDAHGASWDESFATLQRVGAALSLLPRDGATTALLQHVAQWPFDEWLNLLQLHRTLVETLEVQQASLLQIHSFLTHPELVAPPEMQMLRTQLLERFDNVLYDETLLDDVRGWRDEYSLQYAQWHAAQNAPERWLGLRRLEQSDEWRAVERLSQLTTRRFDDVELAEQMRTERDKLCRFDGALRGEPFCAACRLKLGERVLLRDTNEITSQVETVLTSFRQSIQEGNVRDFLQRHEQGSELWAWSETGDNSALISLLDSEMLQLLEEAFRPRRHVKRSWEQLQTSTQSCRTRQQWHDAFMAWLDADDHLNDDDEVFCQ